MRGIDPRCRAHDRSAVPGVEEHQRPSLSDRYLMVVCNESTQRLGQGPVNCFSQLAVGIVFDLACIIENHDRAGRIIFRPNGQAGVAGVTGTGKVDPGIADLGGERPGLLSSTGGEGRQVGVVENKRYLAAMECTRPPVQ